MIKAFPIDTTRIYITGGSMGGVATWYLAEYRPTLFAAAVPVVGGGDTTSAVARKIMNMGWWAYHAADDATIPVRGSRTMVATLRRLLKAENKDTSNIRYTEYSSGGHGIFGQAYADTAMHRWLFAQRKVVNSTGARSIPKPISRQSLLLPGIAGSQRFFTLKGARVSYENAATSNMLIRIDEKDMYSIVNFRR